jgi:hypothetical protein
MQSRIRSEEFDLDDIGSVVKVGGEPPHPTKRQQRADEAGSVCYGAVWISIV